MYVRTCAKCPTTGCLKQAALSVGRSEVTATITMGAKMSAPAAETSSGDQARGSGLLKLAVLVLYTFMKFEWLCSIVYVHTLYVQFCTCNCTIHTYNFGTCNCTIHTYNFGTCNCTIHTYNTCIHTILVHTIVQYICTDNFGTNNCTNTVHTIPTYNSTYNFGYVYIKLEWLFYCSTLHWSLLSPIFAFRQKLREFC
jgi:hypothetical protein